MKAKLEDLIERLDISEVMMLSIGVAVVICCLLCLPRWMQGADGRRIHPILLSSLAMRGQNHSKVDSTKGRKHESEKTVAILFNKPEKVLTSHVSEDERLTVYSIIENMEGFVSSTNDSSINDNDVSFEQATGISSKLHAVGRLDADTSGLLILTNDGSLVHHVTNPNAPTHTDEAIKKTYEALIMGHHDEKSLKPLWEGVDIGAKYGGLTLPVNDLQILGHPNHKSTLVSLTISEGKNRQVRRMFHALGSGVMKLKRTNIGDLNLDGVDVGKWRILSDDEVVRHLQWQPRELVWTSTSKSVMHRKEKGNDDIRKNRAESGRPGAIKRRRRNRRS